MIGSIGAAASGAALPVFAYLFGKIVNNIGALTGSDLISNVNQTVLYFVYLAIGTFVASYLEMSLWMLSGTFHGPRTFCQVIVWGPLLIAAAHDSMKDAYVS